MGKGKIAYEPCVVARMSHGCGTIFTSRAGQYFGDFIEKFGMTAKGEATASSLHGRIHSELVDSFDEELEMEIDDDRLAKLLADIADHPDQKTIDRRFYFQELLRLQCELVKLQDWVVHQKLKVVVIFEGRDAAGKGGVIKRITQRMNPRVCRVAALPAPNDRERTQWYFQRYVSHLPAGGEIVLFDRSWYNRAGVERVMGFCTDADYEEFFHTAPEFERMLVRSGIVLIKYWFSITDDEQHFRFMMRLHDPLKQWKLSPMGTNAAAYAADQARRGCRPRASSRADAGFSSFAIATPNRRKSSPGTGY